MNDFTAGSQWWLRVFLPAREAARWRHRLFAEFFGYFWMPCPVCQQMTGGHEWTGACVSTGESGQGIGICPQCESAGCGEEYERQSREEHAAQIEALEAAGWATVTCAMSTPEPQPPIKAGVRAALWRFAGYDPDTLCRTCKKPVIRTGPGSTMCPRGRLHMKAE